MSKGVWIYVTLAAFVAWAAGWDEISGAFSDLFAWLKSLVHK